MNRYEEFEYLLKVIKSCETLDQVTNAKNMGTSYFKQLGTQQYMCTYRSIVDRQVAAIFNKRGKQ